ncbi:MAG: hypothetical protein ABI910_00130 [Gemmatimonadota bacterium]
MTEAPGHESDSGDREAALPRARRGMMRPYRSSTPLRVPVVSAPM